MLFLLRGRLAGGSPGKVSGGNSKRLVVFGNSSPKKSAAGSARAGISKQRIGLAKVILMLSLV